MIVKEHVARKLACASNPLESLCFGANCMAWRWVNTDDELGYCGLGGIPLDLQDQITPIAGGLQAD